MTRQVITGYVDPDGRSERNWSRRIHATEQQLGYYRKYRTRHGDVLRLIRMQAGPIEAEPQMPFVRLLNIFLASLALWLVIIGWGLSLIGGAS